MLRRRPRCSAAIRATADAQRSAAASGHINRTTKRHSLGDVSQGVVADSPAEAIRRWLLDEWNGALRPQEVLNLFGEDADGRDAWYFVVLLPEPAEETWDPEALSDLARGVRDKALEVGLPYPWYVVPRTASDEAQEEDEEEDETQGEAE